MHQFQKGFTLIEIMVVVVIIGILASMAVVTYMGQSEKARQRVTSAQLHELSGVVEAFQLNHGKLPRKLNHLVFRPSYVEENDWPGYLREVPRDGWGNEFVYRIPGSDSFAYDLMSLGRDGNPGGEKFDRDLINHAKR